MAAPQPPAPVLTSFDGVQRMPYRAGPALAVETPIRRQQRLLANRPLDVNQRPGGQPAAGCKTRGSLGPKARVEGRIQEHDVEGSRWPGQDRKGIAFEHLGAVCAEARDRRAQGPGKAGITLDQDRGGRAPRECLDSERATTGEKIEATGARDPRCQPVEQRLANTVRRWTQTRTVRHIQLRSTKTTGDHPDLVWRLRHRAKPGC